MGGEGVVVAQLLNESQGLGYGIRGVVSIAPTQWRPEVILRHAKYMQLFGSYDQLTSRMTGPDGSAIYSGFRIYDRAHRPKTHFWIYGARHNPFNRVWVASGDHLEKHLADIARPPQDHEHVARCLINAFFQDVLLGQHAYEGYMEGTILPRSLDHLEIYTQHSREPRVVIDNFGDADEQVPLMVQPLDKSSNSRNEQIATSPAGVTVWNDVEHTAIAQSPHNTKGVELAWDVAQAWYRSGVGGASGAPTDVLALRIGQFLPDLRNPDALPSDAFVVLSDGVNEAVLRLGAVAPIPFPDSAPRVLTPMRTARLPLDAFQAANPALDLANLRSVAIQFMARPLGHVLADDIELGG